MKVHKSTRRAFSHASILRSHDVIESNILTELGQDESDPSPIVTAQPTETELMPWQRELHRERQLRHHLEVQLARVQQELRSLQAHLDECITTQEPPPAEFSPPNSCDDEREIALLKEKELSELKSRMIRTISHEYRTPLTVISLAAESLAHQYSRLNAKQRHSCFQQICRATQHMNKLINEVLWVSQAEAGEMKVLCQATSLVRVCRQSIDELAVVSPEDGVRIHVQVTGGDREVVTDAALLQQLLTHLLSNALKYSAPDQAVQLSLEITSQLAVFKVCDRGIGIPPEDCSRLFDCFHRAGNVGTIPGTGLGLAIARKCAELLGGTITFESELEVGSCFTVTLPIPSP